MPPALPPRSIGRCSAQSRSFLRGPDGPCGASTWTAPALRQSHRTRKNRDQSKISSDQSVHGLRGTPRTSSDPAITAADQNITYSALAPYLNVKSRDHATPGEANSIAAQTEVRFNFDIKYKTLHGACQKLARAFRSHFA